VGARGLNNLASKLLLTLFPPNAPFFKFNVDPSLLEELSRQNEQVRSQVEETLGKMERMVMKKFESEGARTVAFQTLRQLILSGNSLLYFPVDGSGARLFRLDHYVVRRDADGNVLEIITQEKVAPKFLPETAQAILGERVEEPGDPDPEAEVDLFTYIQFDEGKWKVFQELRGQVVPESEGFYPKDKTPYLALTFTRIHGEDYGRGYIEEYLGDLIEVEGLSKAIGEAAAASAKVVILVRPGGTTDIDDVVEADNLAVIEGREEDIGTVQIQKSIDLRVAAERLTALEQRLSFAFLLHTAIQRDAERVTAEEIRFMAQELEDALGGVYSVQSLEFQLPLVKLLKHRMEKSGDLPRLPSDIDLDIAITTGIEALGRGHDLNKLEAFLAGALRTAPPEVVAQYVNWGTYLKQRATAIGLDTEGLVKSDEQIAQEQQQAQMAQMAQTLGPEGLKQVGGAIQQGVKQQGES